MHCRFLLSAPQGPIELTPDDLTRPFLVSPDEKHPFLTLKDYFSALQSFILLDNGQHLETVLATLVPPAMRSLAEISEIQICSEKHGAYYHIASILLIGSDNIVKLALTTALSDAAKAALKNEFQLIQQLSAGYPKFLPKMYHWKSITWETDSGTEEFYVALGEWLDDYHEWHLGHNPETGKQQICLWDYGRGFRFLRSQESFELLRQAAYILTSFYEESSFSQVYPWHHGAGDFVVKAAENTFQVKLVTVRQYEPLIYFDKPAEHDRLIALIHFLLNLSLRVRLDRLNGVEGPAWLEESAVRAAVAGFLAALEAQARMKSSMKLEEDEFLTIMQSFAASEIYDMYDSLLTIYADEDQDDFNLIRENLTDHCQELHNVLRDFSQP